MLPARLVELGADVVVAFTTMINSGGHELFVAKYLDAALRESDDRKGHLNSANEVARKAAHAADVVWRELEKDPPAYQRALATGARPLEGEGVLRVVTAPGIDPRVEPLAPGRWGCSTN